MATAEVEVGTPPERVWSVLTDPAEVKNTLTYELSERGDGTQLSLSQDNNASPEEAEHSRAMWAQLVAGVKEAAESS